MSLSKEERSALAMLEGLFGTEVIPPEEVRKDSGLEVIVRANLEHLLKSYAHLKAFEATDWEAEMERRRKQKEERDRVRLEKHREKIILGYMSGLIPKAQTVLGFAEFVTDEDEFFLGSAPYFTMSYDRITHLLRTYIGEDVWTDDLTQVNGGCPPRSYVNGYKALWDYLESKEEK